MKEIGSEFWLESPLFNIVPRALKTEDKRIRYLSTGRSALNYILSDMKLDKNYRHIKKIFLPSFCCESMISPFFYNDYEVEFYSLLFKNGDIEAILPELSEEEGILLTSYFGFHSSKTLMYLNHKCLENAGVVIYDNTHSWLCNNENLKSKFDYIFTSYRKWIYCPGIAKAEKEKSDFLIEVPDRIDINFIEMRNAAAVAKQQYIINNKGEKDYFLNQFKCAEKMIQNEKGYSACDEYSYHILENVDKEKIRKTRRRNAKFLLDKINDLDFINPLFDVLHENDSPLCVPVVVNSQYRDFIRCALVEKELYLPIHWPLSTFHQKLTFQEKQIYESELSLVCDQRYDLEDMQRIITELKKLEIKL